MSTNDNEKSVTVDGRIELGGINANPIGGVNATGGADATPLHRQHPVFTWHDETKKPWTDKEVTAEPDPVRVQVANEGAALITGDRQQDYGSPQVNFARIAGYWNIHLAKQLTAEITPRQVAELMVLLKMARTINSPKRDSYVDIVGYAALSAELAEDEK